ncbi:MAG: carbohydrate kinase [Clostridia bacterium]|nr:carbohydrate kinase [Clostridia bacterium]
MSKLFSIGELLIDFQSVGYGGLKETKQFVKNAGGAPANVCVQAVKLGQKAAYLTKVGNDGFGEFLIDTLKAEGIDTEFISKSDEYDTSLAFVSFQQNGEREFSFYRKAAADLHFTVEDFKGVKFNEGDVLEFGSVALKTRQARDVHSWLINNAESAKAVICFDPNLRFNLWESSEELKSVVNEFSKYADVMKVGKDELEFITDMPEQEAVKKLFTGKLKLLFVTDGGHGAKLYLADGREYKCAGYSVKTVDTTGAGDSFFGGAIAQIMEEGLSVDGLINNKTDYAKILDFACKCGAYTTTGYGAIPAMGNRKNIDKAVK